MHFSLARESIKDYLNSQSLKRLELLYIVPDKSVQTIVIEGAQLFLAFLRNLYIKIE
ncbi:hypothetical protein COXBURSA331_A1523 [Coxiella burnetii RSA 331]|nr:hypothetical protein COXBURSA331_A1523 [Coxiella burnetii RSA 331]